jgi:LacI family transcriptional regulator
MRKVTIQDIATQAGVSKATVSRVLNHKPDVDPVTRGRILRIVEELGFVPDIAATGLAAGRSRLIGVLVPSLTWPLIPEIMRGVAEIVEHTSYELVLYSISADTHDWDRSDVIDRILATRLVAGLLAIYPGQTAQHLRKLHRQGFPMVLLDDQEKPPEEIPWVGADQQVGAYEATRHLLQHGHRRIAHIQGPLKYKVSHDRYQGYCQALTEAGIALDPALVLPGDFLPTSGKECAHHLFSLDERPTAIFAASDLMALGVFNAAEQYGLRVPEDLAVVGFDDIDLAAHMQPALTTVKQPLYEMGRRAVESLLQIVDAPHRATDYLYTRQVLRARSSASAEEQASLHTTLDTLLTIRESCGVHALVPVV